MKNDYNWRYLRSKNGWMNIRFCNLKSAHKRRGFKLNFTKSDFIEWLYKNRERFNYLFSAWEKNNWDVNYTPSVNRLDDTKGYSLDNLELLTWRRNNELGHKGIWKLVQERKPVILKKLDVEKAFVSSTEAAKFLGVSKTSLSDASKNLSRRCKGWMVIKLIPATTKKPRRLS